MLSCVLQTTVILGHARSVSSVERSQILQTGSVWQWDVWQIVAFRPSLRLISPQIIRITFNSQANFTVSRLSQPVPRFFDGPQSVARPGAIFIATRQMKRTKWASETQLWVVSVRTVLRKQIDIFLDSRLYRIQFIQLSKPGKRGC